MYKVPVLPYCVAHTWCGSRGGELGGPVIVGTASSVEWRSDMEEGELGREGLNYTQARKHIQ